MTTVPQLPTPVKFWPALLLYYLIYWFLTLIPTVLLLIFCLLVTPHFQEIFKDFRTTLPLITQWMMVIAATVREDYLWIPILLLAFVVPVLPALLTLKQAYRPNRVMYVLIALILMLLATQIGTVLAMWSLFAPLLKLIESVSGGDAGGG